MNIMQWEWPKTKRLYRRLKASWLNFRGNEAIQCRYCGGGVPVRIVEIQPSGTIVEPTGPCRGCEDLDRAILEVLARGPATLDEIKTEVLK